MVLTAKPVVDEELGRTTVIAQTAQQARRKTTGTRSWLVVTESGQRLEEVGKQAIMARTGLPARDLRVLDPLLSYPSTILGREKAIVVNLEQVKAIVTAKEVFMAKSINPLVVQFVEDLEQRVAAPRQEPVEGSGSQDAPVGARGSPTSGRLDGSNGDGIGGDSDGSDGRGPKLLPFEFRALEACLESACKCLESETRTLEEEAYPALDELSTQISTLNNERVRQIKSRLVAISGRVQKVRDELENLLDDDNDMAEMYLTEKLIRYSLDQRSPEEDLGTTNINHDDERVDEESDGNSSVSDDLKPNIQELEMLLEAYFVLIDGSFQKLADMNEYVDDTQDYINIMLGDKQNKLLEMGVMFSIANMILNAGIVVVGLFGMNITIELFSGKPIQFWSTALSTAGACVILYLLSITWARNNKLI